MKEFIGRNAGVYALFWKGKLYYVGLATAQLCRQCMSPKEDDEDDDVGEDAGDDEPSLGSLNAMQGNGARYHSAGGRALVDCEADNSDDEPSLCGIYADCKGGDSDGEVDLG